MGVRYLAANSALTGKPVEAVVLDDDTGQWLIVSGDNEDSQQRTKGAQGSIARLQKLNPNQPLDAVLGAYMNRASYTKTKPWTKSPFDVKGTAQALSKEILGS